MSVSPGIDSPVKEKIYNDTDWDTYAQYRPAYPPSLINLILDHHRQNSNDFHLAHDVGAGSGVFARLLVPHFSHIHVSDPSASNIAQARTVLAKEPPAATFTLSMTPAETAHECVLPSSVNLLSIASAAHWTDISPAVTSAARALSPGGTFTVIYYHVFPSVVAPSPQTPPSPLYTEIQTLWSQLCTDVLADILKMSKGGSDKFTDVALRATRHCSIGNDYIPLPEELFDPALTRRINFNVYGRGNEAFQMVELEKDLGESRLREAEVIEERNFPESEASGWRYEVGKGWLEGLFGTLPGSFVRLQKFGGMLEEIDGLIEALPGKMVTVEFPVALLLATRR